MRAIKKQCLQGVWSMLFLFSIAMLGQPAEHKEINFETQQFTNPHLSLSPNGEDLLFDVLGDLYLVPVSGGTAIPLLRDAHWNMKASFSPDGKSIAYLSDRGGNIALWQTNLDTGKSTSYALARKHWSATYFWLGNALGYEKDGSIYYFTKDNTKEACYSAIAVPPYQVGSISATGWKAYCGGQNLQEIDLATGTSHTLFETDNSAIQPKVNARGDAVAYLSPRPSFSGSKFDLMLWNRTTSEHDTIAAVSAAERLLPDYNFGASGDYLYFPLEGKIHRYSLATKKIRPLPIRLSIKKSINAPLQHVDSLAKDSITHRIIRWPDLDAKRNRFVYTSLGELYFQEKKVTEPRVLATGKGFAFSPALSPDGNWIAYVQWQDEAQGQIFIRSVKEEGKPIPITKKAGRYINPTWSPDGKQLAYIEDASKARWGLKSQHAGPNYRGWDLSLQLVNVSGTKKLSSGFHTKTLDSLTIAAVRPGRFYPAITYHNKGKKLYINTFNQQKDQPEIREISLKGNIKSRYPIPFSDEASMAHDGKRVAWVAEGRLWIGSPQENGVPIHKAVLSESDPRYLRWIGSKELIWTERNTLVRYDLESNKNYRSSINLSSAIDKPNGSYALVGGRIITMEGDKIIENGTLIIKDNRIVAVGSKETVKVPAGMKQFSLEGTTIMPGLIDVHAHDHHEGPEIWQRQNSNYIGKLAFGVTGLYDPAAISTDVFGKADLVRTGKAIGPRIFSSGAVIMDAPKQTEFRALKDSVDVARVVRNHLEYGARMLKEYDQKDRRKRQALREEVALQGGLLTSHISEQLAERLSRVVDGYSALEHELADYPVYKDVIELMAQSGIHYTPTFIVSPGFGDRYLSSMEDYSTKLQTLMPPFQYQEMLSHYMHLDPRLRKRYSHEIIRAGEMVEKFVAAGGKLSVGAHGNGPPGLGTHWELWALTEGGLSPMEALRAATYNGADKLGLAEELGSIKEGKLADIVVLNNNPLTDIRATADVMYTIKNGVLYKASTMKSLWPEQETLAPWPWEVE
ncbi:amidohydrolase family protein [Mesonia aquimarina]|uniref:amidohydrolase family protein n=1 Tax=Mesonia aquimarina TaxID=1504967 RepID=UPI000EF5AA87|nr:amidohydrolase family protein [Mesonia aquimarina]